MAAVPTKHPVRGDALRLAAIVALTLLVFVVGYLLHAVPGRWFPKAAASAFGPRDLKLVRGVGHLAGESLVVGPSGADGITLVTVTSDLRSSDYSAVQWMTAGMGEDLDARLIWRNDLQPDKLNFLPLRVRSGHAVASIVANNPAWIGRITGLALAIHGPLAKPFEIRGVIAKPMGAFGIVGDRLDEWLEFEPWRMQSIGSITGGADVQFLPLPATLAGILGASALVVTFIARRRPGILHATLPHMLAALFLVGWFVLDGRWTWNLLRQERATAVRYGGKDDVEKHLASDDGQLFEFVRKALAVMPAAPVRVFIAADGDYFGGRAAYHLYPHDAFFDARSERLPAPDRTHAGDWILVFRRPGVQFDREQGKLRWDANPPVHAELKLVGAGGALFVIR